MNFKTLTAIGAAAAVAGLLAAPQAQADGTAWIYDGYSSSGGTVVEGPTGDYSRILSNQTNVGWKDVIGWSQFETSAIKVDWVGSDVTFTTYTNYAWGGFPNVPLADWFFDTDPGQAGFEYAFAPYEVVSPPGLEGDLKTFAAPVSSTTAMGNIGLGTQHFAAATDVCNDNGDCGPGRAPEVDTTGDSGVTGYTGITIDDGTSGGSPLVGPYGNASYLHSYSFTLAGINTGAWDSVRVFWGTGWCANDTIEGTAVVPIPAAAWLFGSAILGLGAVGWKRRSTTA